MEGLRDIGDLVLHYVELFDQLGLHEGVNLVGFSLGGLHRRPLRDRAEAPPAPPRARRAGRAPRPRRRGAGLLHASRPKSSPGDLVHDMTRSSRSCPSDPHDVDFTVDRYRETRTTAIITWEQPFDRVLAKWLGQRRHPDAHRVGRRGPARAARARTRLGREAPERDGSRRSRTRGTSCSTSRRTHARPWRASAHRDADVRGAAARHRRRHHELDVARARRVRSRHRER